MTHGITGFHSAGPAPEEAAARLAALTGRSAHDVAVVLGSGWSPAADALGEHDAEIPIGELPGFPTPGAAGHEGILRSLDVGDSRVMVLLGRTHLYEGSGVAAVVHGVRTAAAAGAGTVLLTNAAGALREDFGVGTPVMISDHLNMTATSPLTGADFVDLVGLYSPRLRALAREIEPTLREGVYAGMPGPHFETPAEIRMLRTLGADLVGMSTVLEAIAARAAGMEVFGLSLATNPAAGVTGQPLDQQDVLATSRACAGRMGRLLRELVVRS